mmetsp:Transcript_114483/g.278025  ORF Transcript_114483/g.278025 Transcript_114483/m.278025 type:complete len:92 (+) Transcript_114483:82-357(+)
MCGMPCATSLSAQSAWGCIPHPGVETARSQALDSTQVARECSRSGKVQICKSCVAGACSICTSVVRFIMLAWLHNSLELCGSLKAKLVYGL